MTGVALALVSVLIVAACTPVSAPSGATPGAATPGAATPGAEGTPRRGGTLQYVPYTKIPHAHDVIRADKNAYLISHNFYEPLYEIRIGDNGEPAITGLLAEKTDISPDGLTWTIHLRRGVKFHDGSDFDAAAVKANLDIRQGNIVIPGWENHFILRFAMDPIKEVKVVDAATVQLVLGYRSATFQMALASTGFGMQSPTAMAAYPSEEDYRCHAAGTGPFKLDGCATEDRVTVVRNDAYWGEKPYLDGIVFRLELAALPVAVAALEAGDVHVVDRLSGADYQRLESEGKFSVQATTASSVNVMWFNTAQAPTSDKRVRQAIVYGTNLDAWVEAVPLVERADSIISKTAVGHAKQTLYPYDPAKAKQLLAEAGIEPGTPLTIITTPSNQQGDFTALWKQDLDNIGFDTIIRSSDQTAFNAAITAPGPDSDWSLGLHGALAISFPDAEAALIRFASDQAAPVGQGWSHYSNPRYDSLIAELGRTFDNAERVRIMKELQAILWEDLPVYPAQNRPRPYAYSKAVHGIDFSRPDTYPRLDRAWLEQP